VHWPKVCRHQHPEPAVYVGSRAGNSRATRTQGRSVHQRQTCREVRRHRRVLRGVSADLPTCETVVSTRSMAIGAVTRLPLSQ